MTPEILATVTRGETVESIHRGHLIIVDGDGDTVALCGDPATVTFWRSSAKSFQAMPFLTSGAAARFNFTDAEIALACGSHSGEEVHVAAARKMLEKCGLSEADLRCGAQVPFDEKRAEEMIRRNEKATQLHNNCSGKHAAMLAFAKYLGADLQSYERVEHPVQQAILNCVSQFTDIPKSEIKIGVDGCAAPNFAVPLAAMAKAFARLVAPENFDAKTRDACRRIVSAGMNHPEMIGGTARLDTLIMQSLQGKIFSKIGAEGVYSASILPSPEYKKGLGIAFKIEDGDDKRARAVVLIEVLRRLGILNGTNDEKLREYSPMQIENRRGDVVGNIIPSFDLNLSRI